MKEGNKHNTYINTYIDVQDHSHPGFQTYDEFTPLKQSLKKKHGTKGSKPRLDKISTLSSNPYHSKTKGEYRDIPRNKRHSKLNLSTKIRHS